MSDTPNKKHAGERSDRDINAGHNRAEDVTLSKIERTNKLGINGKENAMIVDSHGKVVLDTANSPYFKKSRTGVKSNSLGTLMMAKAAKDSIITHSHPNNPRSGLAGRIGNTLSSTDVANAVRWDAKEIRATTPTYTYSIKRPKGGWGTTPEDVIRTFGRPGRAYDHVDGTYSIVGGSGLYGDVFRKGTEYLSQHGYTRSNVSRADTIYQHQALKELAKKYGWSYTRKRNI